MLLVWWTMPRVPGKRRGGQGLTVRAADADVDAATGRVQRVGAARGERCGGPRVQHAL